MNSSRLQQLLQSLDVSALVQQASDATLLGMVATRPSQATHIAEPQRLLTLALLYERQGFQAYQELLADRRPRHEVEELFSTAYTCWRTFVFLPDEDSALTHEHISATGLELVAAGLDDEELPAPLLLAFHLAASALLGARTAEARLDLQRFPLTSATPTAQNWQQVVQEHIFTAFVLLVRKGQGWRDIQQALQNIAVLRSLQKTYEEDFLSSTGNEAQQARSALVLVGLYHLAQIITLTGEYLQRDATNYDTVLLRLDHHHEQAVIAFEESDHLLFAHLADLLWIGCRELAHNAIYRFLNARLGIYVERYLASLTSFDCENPVIELWPGQQAVLQQHLFDSFQRAILVEMPTSGGKTLLAKFIIAQTKSFLSSGLVVYIVPTRALVNQVTFDLRQAFASLFTVEQATPAFELNPLEDRLLRTPIDVLVVTPEKLDLLVRSDHPIVKDIALVVVDEAHHLADASRGTRLEFLLSTIKRDFSNTRFLLLSPFLPNGTDLARWLGEDLSLSIQVAWKPNSKLIGAVSTVKEQNQWELVLETLATARVMDVAAAQKISLGPAPHQLTSSAGLTREVALTSVARGSVLILCLGPQTTIMRAREIADMRDPLPGDPLLDAVCHFVEQEQGANSPLITCLRRGVAYHHAGLSSETRWLIEELIRAGQVSIVCGTTTLAQGMNFPITTVIIESIRKGYEAELGPEEIWNVAGRAGRTLVDTLGVVAFPTPDTASRQKIEALLQKDAQSISSQLTQLIKDLDEAGFHFTQDFLRNHANASPLLQFLAHALRVSGDAELADEVENVLRASLIYHQLQKEDPRSAQRLVHICRTYLLQSGQYSGVLPLADKTGFATPSVLALLHERDQDHNLRSSEYWQPAVLFAQDLAPLARRIELIANLPEIQLNMAGSAGRPKAERLAGIVRDWVRGMPLAQLTAAYAPQGASEMQRTNFSRDLFQLVTRAAWGIGALETVCLADNASTDWDAVGYVPSMIYFGVATREAVMLRMAGMPRVLVEELALLWKQSHQPWPESYSAVRDWLSQLSQQDLRAAIPQQAVLTPGDLQILWQSFRSGR